MSYAVQQQALAIMIGAAAGTPVYWENQAKPRPPYPYVSLKIISSLEVGFGEVRRSKESDAAVQLDVEVRHDEEITLSINAHAKPGNDFAATSLAYARAVRRAFGRPDVLQVLRDAGLAVAVLGATRDLSGLGDGGEMQRTQFDVQFNTAVTDIADPEDFIERIQATITFKGPDPTLEREAQLDVNTGD